jgi:hypothetical protein
VGAPRGCITYAAMAFRTPRALTGRAFGGTGVVLGGAMIAASYLIESPIERLTSVWDRDPGMLNLRPSIAPALAPTQGGITLGLTGRF